jgi:UDP-glucose 4-epimerase
VPNVVVIGANGFIGSHLVDALAGNGYRVRAFDRFSSSEPTFESTGVEIVRGEFLSRADLEAAVRGQDYVVHMLSTTTPATAESDPTLDIRTNLAQTVELLEASVAANVSQFYFASTGGAIYGQQGKAAYAESDRALPLSPYGIGKLTIEHYLDYFRVTHGLQSTALRISNPYGPRQRPHKKQGLIPIVLERLLAGEEIVRFGDGSMVRDYIYVGDLVDMIVTVISSDEHRHALYNIGSGHGNTVNEVFAAIERVTGRTISVVERPVPATFVDRVVLDTSRYSAEFGVHPLKSLDEGIRLTFEGMEEAHHE